MVLSSVIEPKDDIDTEIVNLTMSMMIGLQLDSLIFRDKKMWEDYFQKVLNLTKNLLKANEHYRKYLAEEKRFLEEYKEKCIKDPNTNIFLTTDAVSLNTEIDGFLSQIKAGLDTLATSLNPVLGLSLNKWSKANDSTGKRKSGVKIVKSLDNLGEPLRSRAEDLRKLIETNMDWITEFVFLRDNVHHHGGLKNITDITYDFRSKEVIPQTVIHGTGREYVRNFLLRNLQDMSMFFNAVLVCSIHAKAPPGMRIQRNPPGHIPSHNWVILTQK